MDINILVSLILTLCKPYQGETQLKCFDILNNCSVRTNGQVVSMETFGKECFSKINDLK